MEGLTAAAATFDEVEAASLKLELTPQGLVGGLSDGEEEKKNLSLLLW